LDFSRYQTFEQHYIVTAADVSAGRAIINIGIKQYARINYADCAHGTINWVQVNISVKPTPEDFPYATLAAGIQAQAMRFHGLYEGYIDHLQFLVISPYLTAGDLIYFGWNISMGQD
jgi:hypothetical protein